MTAAIDTGAAYCLFESGLAGQLGLDLAAGIPMRFRTANSSFDAFGHNIEIEVLGVHTQAIVYFFANPAITRNVLGRTGWLDRVRLGLVDYDRQLYLSAYDDEATA